ncbi:MAG: hypothetical protein ACFB4I_10385 [Cyanophyceae cyanobacterium]
MLRPPSVADPKISFNGIPAEGEACPDYLHEMSFSVNVYPLVLTVNQLPVTIELSL